ncbi:type II toxin-antitoxin system VapB family antitoxin [Mycobacterium sp.]|uniref:type II toxin-antitoxin system VapB family antitoxin n=1 Tax=Mycobacterium sp. TaxID=1785 RepID=UPI003BAA83C3
MPVKRTTIELDEDLVGAAQAVTGDTLRATVEHALRQLVAAADESAAARRQRIVEHIAHAGDHVDVDVLLSDQAWR